MAVLRFLGANPRLKDGTIHSDVRCTCLARANLRAVIRDGEVIAVGCPVCGKECVIEIMPDGDVGFFPMGTVVIGGDDDSWRENQG